MGLRDWVEEWQNEEGYMNGKPPACKSGPSTINNLIYAAALKSAANLMKLTEEPNGDEYLIRADTINMNIEKFCWSEERGMYRDGPKVELYTQHAQVWAVLSGLACGDAAKKILQNSLSGTDVAECTYVFSFFLFRALEIADLYHLTEKQWDKWKNALKYNLTTWPEDLDRQRSDCHGWGAPPIYQFTRCFLEYSLNRDGRKSG